MIYFLFGKLVAKKINFVVLETGGIGFKIFTSLATVKPLKIGDKANFFCYTHIRQDGIELYGFLSEKEKDFFELLISADGVGPKAAMKIMNIAKIDGLMAAIKQGRSDLLTKAAGIGSKKSQRIVLELKDKIKRHQGGEETALMEADIDIEKALKNFGYKQNEIREAVKHIPPDVKKINERLKAALKFLSK